MADDALDYQALIREALRGVVQQAMHQVAEEGFPGEHHFYLGFRTDAPGVSIPAFLRERYPEEITVVLQNQFWDLEVDHEGFSVTLAFDADRSHIAVPWGALTSFVDPAAEFALRFPADGDGEEGEPTAEDEAEEPGEGSADATADVVDISRFKKKDG
jgi:hypothetical protein